MLKPGPLPLVTSDPVCSHPGRGRPVRQLGHAPVLTEPVLGQVGDRQRIPAEPRHHQPKRQEPESCECVNDSYSLQPLRRRGGGIWTWRRMRRVFQAALKPWGEECGASLAKPSRTPCAPPPLCESEEGAHSGQTAKALASMCTSSGPRAVAAKARVPFLLLGTEPQFLERKCFSGGPMRLPLNLVGVRAGPVRPTAGLQPESKGHLPPFRWPAGSGCR